LSIDIKISDRLSFKINVNKGIIFSLIRERNPLDDEKKF